MTSRPGVTPSAFLREQGEWLGVDSPDGRDLMVVDAIIVVGASTGGLHPLRRIIEALPHHCRAAVFVVMHSGAAASILPEILSWHSRIDVSFATDGGSIEAGHVMHHDDRTAWCASFRNHQVTLNLIAVGAREHDE